MQFRLLGALEAGAGDTVVEIGPPKQRAVLAILLLHVGEIVSVDRLIEMLWGEEPPRTAAHSIQIYVSDLRKSLEAVAGRRLILTRPPGYQLDTPPETVDAKQFERLVQRGAAHLSSGEPDKAIATLRSALELWRGPALSDFAYEEFAQPYVRRLHDMHLDAIETLASAELDVGRTGQAIPLLEAAIREDPLRERSRELLMVALYRSGRHAEALRNYDKLRQLLRDELGLDPSPGLQRLRDRVLLHDPSLVPIPQGEPQRVATRNPYKGLQPFGENDAQDFFGREALVERLVGSLESGQRLIALVGPSGSGKSSVVAAGLTPRMREGAVAGSERWTIVPLTLTADPMGEVRAAVSRATGTQPQEGRLLPASTAARVALVLDQFEQLFTAAEESRRNQFLAALTAELRDPDGQLTVILTLRADFYDRPLQHPEFSAAFIPGVVHVLPMTAGELEAAVVEPAEQVGVKVEPALLAELVAESVARPGSLPLLQYALTELFEQRTGPMLTRAGYAALGGLRGVLSRRAEATFLALSADEQQIATQVFLRMVRLGRGSADIRRWLTLSELTDLGTDAVILSTVLTAFGRHRLMTFDHDPATGEATVEMAHEALLTEWERLAGWVDRHRAALRRRDALLAAVEEWDLSERNADYLLTGSRLAEFETWSSEGSLQLTTRERDFLAAGLERRRAEAPVAYLWTNQEWLTSLQAVSGFDRAVTEFGLVGQKFSIDDLVSTLTEQHGDGWRDGLSDEGGRAIRVRAQQDEMRRLARKGVGLIIMDTVPVEEVEVVAREYPDTHFALGFIGQEGTEPNVAYLTSIDSEPSFLAGAAAAMKTRSGIIGFIGGVDAVGIWQFEAGYEAGARAVDPNITILAEYLAAWPNFGGFDDMDVARSTALEMYRYGADVIFHAAGNAGLGLFDAATQYSEAEGRQLWAIGVDTDQYETVPRLAGATNAEAWRAHILTSVLKGIDALAYAVVAEHAQGKFTPGNWNWGLASGASDLSYSGGYIDDIRSDLEGLKAKIISGEIHVPRVPDSRLDAAAELGLDRTTAEGLTPSLPQRWRS